MKEVFEFHAFYNKKENDSMIDFMKKLPEDALKKDMGTFFKSILETLMHMILTNIMWMRRTNELFQNKYTCITQSEIMKISDKDIKDLVKKDYKYAFKIKSRLDDLFEKYVNELDKEDFYKRLRYKDIKGEEMERTYWHMIIHIFNHETHHRGVISAMLDQLKINNDFSGVLMKQFYKEIFAQK
jgi:uncharacterized damage-inducible protein DinB